MTRYLTAAFIVSLLLALLSVRPAKAGVSEFPPPPHRLLAAARQVFHQHMWTAICVAWFESRYDKLNDVRGSSWSPTGDHGWMQINYLAHHRSGETEEAFHARMAPLIPNLQAAYAISRGGTNWYAWTTYGREGLCRGLG